MHELTFNIYTDKALCGGNEEYYFFAKVKENKSSTENGYWEEIGVTEPIFSGTDQKVGMKKYLVFHIAQGAETSWVMQQYHICSSGFDHSMVSYHGDDKVGENWSEWILCRVYETEKNMYSQDGVNYCNSDDDDSGTDLSWQDQVFLSLELDNDDMEGITMPQ
uniref:NAC family transcription factor n=1 Tax=Melilotus albus TaxID=47082 RepID=A0A896W3B8_MELAB|nr:NAC family transcription factor [Melilotus albus]